MKAKKLPKRLVKRSMEEHFEYLERREAFLEKIDAFYRRGWIIWLVWGFLRYAYAEALQTLFELRGSNNA